MSNLFGGQGKGAADEAKKQADKLERERKEQLDKIERDREAKREANRGGGGGGKGRGLLGKIQEFARDRALV